jgi:hypothetical protein
MTAQLAQAGKRRQVNGLGRPVFAALQKNPLARDFELSQFCARPGI